MKIEIEVKDPMVVKVGETQVTVDSLLEVLCALASPVENRWYRFYREGGRTMCEVRQEAR